MPNWCTTSITISHSDSKKIKSFYELLDKFLSHNFIENGFGLDWLENIVGNADIGTIDTGTETEIFCRGQIIYRELNDASIIITTETAWAPELKLWVKLIEKYLPDAEIIYTTEEPGSDIYSTNDPALQDTYVIDNYGSQDLESNWKATEAEVCEVLQYLLKTSETDINKLLEAYENSKADIDVIIHKWDFEDIHKWD